jgi:hypothetical protein
MTTAREKLYEEMVVMVATPPGPGADAEMRKVMSRYRVQTKPGVDVAPGTTARDALGERLLELWRTPPPDVKQKIGLAIDEFRMQLKSSSQPPSPAGNPSSAPRPASGLSARPPLPGARLGARPLVPAIEDDDDSAAPAPMAGARAPASAAHKAPAASAIASGVAGSAPSPMPLPPRPGEDAAVRGRGGRSSAEPVAGGPRKRGRTRGECPKCHSMGVVLARSYSGDEYFSCIYCGWQAYKPTEDDDPNASLAVRLLGQTVPEPPRE